MFLNRNITIQKSNSFKLEKNRYLFSDIFISDNKIIAISVVYPDININFNLIDIIFNNKIYKFNEISIHRCYESSVVCILENEKLKSHIEKKKYTSLLIRYNGIVREFILQKLENNNYELSLFTLFKNDYYLLRTWIIYYNKIGFTNFILYYNGIIDEKVIEKVRNIDLNINIVIVEWDFSYWINIYNGVPSLKNINVISKDLNENYHHAQITAIISCIYRCFL